MKIEVIRIKKLTGDSKLKAFADVMFDGLLEIKGCQVFQGPNGLFASLPSQKDKNDKYWPVAKIADDTFRSVFNDKIIAAYKSGADAPAAVAGSEQEVPF